MHRAIIISLLSFILISQFPFLIGKSPDYSEHVKMAQSRLTTEYYQSSYYPIFPFLGSFFIMDEKFYKLFVSLIIFFLTPLALAHLTKKWYATIFYFGVTNYSFNVISGLYSQSFVILLFIVFLSTKNNWLRGLIWLIGVFTHSTGLILFSTVWVLFLVKENKNSFFAFCSPFWGGRLPNELTNNIIYQGHFPNGLTINELGSLFTKKSPFPFLIKAVEFNWKNNNWHYLFLMLFSFLGAVFFNDRIGDVLGILTVIGFTYSFPDLKNKKIWLFLVLMHLIINILSFVRVSLFTC